MYIKLFQCPNKRKCLDNISTSVFMFFGSFHGNKVTGLLCLAVDRFSRFWFPVHYVLGRCKICVVEVTEATKTAKEYLSGKDGLYMSNF